MFRLLFCLLFVGSAHADERAVEMKMSLVESSSPALDHPSSTSSHHHREEDLATRAHHPPRVPRGSKSKLKDRHPVLHTHRHPRPHPDPDGFFTTPRTFNGSLRVHNPLYPVTEESYSAYAVMLLGLVVFSVGIVGNLALMCIVWHDYYLKNTWNCVLASVAFWDFMVLFFCLPVVIFNELTKRRLAGDLSCRIVPFVEVCHVFCLSVCSHPCSNKLYHHRWHILRTLTTKALHHNLSTQVHKSFMWWCVNSSETENCYLTSQHIITSL